MDFFGAQELAKKRTKWMVVLFSLAVICIACALYAVIVFALPYFGGSATSEANATSAIDWWQPVLFGGTFVSVVLLVGGCSLFKVNQLRAGGSYVARSVWGQKISQSTTDADERKLLNIVEEMAIASGVPVPDVYVMEEAGINAFAAGFNPGDAVIGVTRGCIRSLSRDELQGVVAHEFSHILNGDMRMNIRLMGVLFGILAIAVLGQLLFRGAARAGFYGGGRRSRDKDSGGGVMVLIVIGLAVMAIGYIGVFFGRLIQSAISRQREYLADAAAVQFTRNPEGIAGALKKIGGTGPGGQLKNAHAQETAHFYFSNALRSSFLSSFATHPPLPARIRAIEPNWDGRFVRPEPKPSVPPSSGSARQRAAAPRNSNAFIQTIGVLSAATMERAQAIRQSLEPELDALHKQADTAKAVLIALQISASPAADDSEQLATVKTRVDGAVFREAEKWVARLRAMDFNQRVALLDAALPMAADSGAEALDAYPKLLSELAHGDGEVNLEELAILKTTACYLDQRRRPSRRMTPMGPAEIEMPICVLLSAIVYTTGAEGDAAQHAFTEGARKCNRYLLREPVLIPEDSISYEALETALDLLAKLPNPQKRIIFEGALAVVLADQKVEQEELSLIRVIAAVLALPMPPLQADTE